MRIISIICWLTFSIPLCFAQSLQPSTPVTVLIDQAPVLAVLDHDNSSALSLITLLEKIHAAEKLPSPAPASGPTRASDLLRFGETYGQFATVMSADMTRIISGLGIDWEKEILNTYDPKSAKTEAGKTLRLNVNSLASSTKNGSLRATDCSSWRVWSIASIAATSIPLTAANFASSTGSDTKSG